MSHAPPCASRRSENAASTNTRLHQYSRAGRTSRAFTLQALTRASLPWRHRWRHLLRPGLTRSSWPGPTGKSDPVWTACQKERKKEKKKKRREKILPPSGLLTLTKKSKFSKRACPTQFFKYILILGPVSSFETQKLCKRPISKKVDFCANVDQMSKFLRWTYLAQFFAYIPILKSVLSFETQKLHKWLDSKVVDFCVGVNLKSRFSSQTCLAQFFVTWKPPI